MPIRITSTNYNGQVANVTLYSSTGNTIPYTNATTISLGNQTIPFNYSSTTESNEYGIFSCNFTGFSKTCTINQKTPVDGDGNTYNTIKIGTQVWMSENLKTTKFQDGTPLSNVTEVPNGTWAAAGASNKYWALVNGNSGNTATYGLVYNQFAVTGSTVGGAANNNLCPSGYHVPTSAEFSTLNTFLNTTVGTKMKSTTLWNTGSGYIPGTNSSGFNALPAGLRILDGSWSNLTNYAYIWTATSGVYQLLLYNDATMIQSPNTSPLYGFLVRCLKN